MNQRVAVATMGIAALAGGTAVAAPQLASASSHTVVASARARTHTLRFTDKLAGKAIDKGPLLIQADDDYHGKTLLGTDEINCTFGKTAGHCLVTLSIKGGFLYGTFTETPTGRISGSITGGAGHDKGATGTISSTPHKPIVVKYRD
jgi:hypothetical protein